MSLAESWLCQDQLRVIFTALSTSSTTSSTSTSTTTLEQSSRLISSSSTPPSTLSPRSKSKSGSTTKQKTLQMLNLRGVSLTFLDPSTFARALSQVLREIFKFGWVPAFVISINEVGAFSSEYTYCLHLSLVWITFIQILYPSLRRSTSQTHGLQDCKGDKFVTFFSDHPR